MVSRLKVVCVFCIVLNIPSIWFFRLILHSIGKGWRYLSTPRWQDDWIPALPFIKSSYSTISSAAHLPNNFLYVHYSTGTQSFKTTSKTSQNESLTTLTIKFGWRYPLCDPLVLTHNHITRMTTGVFPVGPVTKTASLPFKVDSYMGCMQPWHIATLYSSHIVEILGTGIVGRGRYINENWIYYRSALCDYGRCPKPITNLLRSHYY